MIEHLAPRRIAPGKGRGRIDVERGTLVALAFASLSALGLLIESFARIGAWAP